MSFYWLHHPIHISAATVYGLDRWCRGWGYARVVDGSCYRPITCDLDPGRNRGELSLVPGTHVAFTSDRAFAVDVLWTPVGLPVLRRRVIDLFRKYKVTGIDLTRATFAGLLKKAAAHEGPAESLALFSVSGRAELDLRKSGARLLSTCPCCGVTTFSALTKGVHILQQSWNGEDFILAPGFPGVLVSTRAAQIITSFAVTGFALTPATEFEWPATWHRPRRPAAKSTVVSRVGREAASADTDGRS